MTDDGMSAPVVAATEEAIERGAELLRAGRLVAFPTETVYGLGGDATSDSAVAAIYAAKGRPQFNPLIVHMPDGEAALSLVQADERARQLAAKFWPGPLTLVLPRRADSRVSLLASAGLETLAVRVPDHPVARALLKAAGRPLAAPSANPSGRVSPTTAEHVAEGLGGQVALILDGGPCRVGLEVDSTRPDGARCGAAAPGRTGARDAGGRDRTDPPTGDHERRRAPFAGPAGSPLRAAPAAAHGCRLGAAR